MQEPQVCPRALLLDQCLLDIRESLLNWLKEVDRVRQGGDVQSQVADYLEKHEASLHKITVRSMGVMCET